MHIIEFEKPEGVIASLGGQTAINLAKPLANRGVRIIGTDCDAIDKAEDRYQFENLLNELDIPRAKGRAVTNIEDGVNLSFLKKQGRSRTFRGRLNIALFPENMNTFQEFLKKQERDLLTRSNALSRNVITLRILFMSKKEKLLLKM
jgi:hypothetical protein